MFFVCGYNVGKALLLLPPPSPEAGVLVRAAVAAQGASEAGWRHDLLKKASAAFAAAATSGRRCHCCRCGSR